MDLHTIDVTTLPDEWLATAACDQRRLALRGNTHAFGRAHELERELRRRAGVPATLLAPAALAHSQEKRPWWRRRSRPALPN